MTPAEFLASPTWLDSQDLIPGGNALQQTNELYNQLLKASAWAWRIAEQNLAAHTAFGQDRFPVDKWGNVYVVPDQNPVRQVNGFAWGFSYDDMNLLDMSLSPLWIEKQKTILFQLNSMGTAGLGSLQFGRVRPVQDEIFVQYSYVTGYCNTTLSQPASAGASQIYVQDPTGLQPAVTGGLLGTIPGSVARIWEPVNSAGSSGGEEAIQVASNWVVGTNPVMLASQLQNNHAAGAGVSELPPEVHQAVVSLTVGLLCRDDVSNDEPFKQTPFGPTVRQSKKGGKAGGLVNHAEGILRRYRPQVH